MLEEGAERDMHEILDEAAAKTDRAAGSDAQKAGDFYGSFMDEAAIESRGLAPLDAELKRIEALASKKDLAGYIGYAQRIGVPQPFASQLGYLWVVAPLLLATMVVMCRLEQTRAGRALIALRGDELAAQSECRARQPTLDAWSSVSSELPGAFGTSTRIGRLG